MMKNKIALISILLSLASVSACGLKPVYAQDSAARQQFQQIYVSEIPNREGQVLRTHLQDLLGASGSRYRLDIKLDKQRREFGIQQDLRVSRYDIVLKADYTLTDNDSGKVILKDSVRIYSAFNRTDSEFSTFVAEENSTEEAAEELAHQINMKLNTFFE